MNIPFIVTAQCAGRLRRRFQPVVIVVGGCLVGAAGVAVLALLSDTTSFAVAFVGYVLVGMGWGTLVPGVVNVAMRDVPPGVSGGASGLVNAARQVGTSVGLAVLGTIGVHAATTAWAGRSAGVPGAAGQAQYVAGGRSARCPMPSVPSTGPMRWPPSCRGTTWRCSSPPVRRSWPPPWPPSGLRSGAGAGAAEPAGRARRQWPSRERTSGR